MNDSISRKDAIALVDKPITPTGDAVYDTAREDERASIKDDLASLPSAETTGDLISRQAALRPFCIAPDGARIPEVDCDNFPVEFSVEFIKKHLLSLPSAEPQTGEWVTNIYKYGKERYVCSNCGRGHTEDSDYCPNCGSFNGG